MKSDFPLLWFLCFIKEIFAKIFSYVLFWKFYNFRSLLSWVDFCVFCEGRAEIFFPHIHISRLFFSCWTILAHPLRINWPYMYVCISFLFFALIYIVCQYHLVLCTVALWCVLRHLFSFEVILAIVGPLFFLIKFRISLSVLQESQLGYWFKLHQIFMWGELSPTLVLKAQRG